MEDKTGGTKQNGNKEGSLAAVDEKQLENNRRAFELFKGAKRFVNLNELGLALENVQGALSCGANDNDSYNQADAYFLAAQICRRAKDYRGALKYIEEGIRTVNPYRADSPKFVLAKGVTQLQLAETEAFNSKRKTLTKAIESFRMAIAVSEVLLNQKAEYRFNPEDVSTIKRYLKIAIFDSAYANDLAGNRRQAIEALDRLFELDPHFSVQNTTFELYYKIHNEKRVVHIAK